ncbi:allantoinase AllB [Gryllotalpicola protaetiae]|uniref:allantoinase n=1 Tax=Gryllotalpicola protaetiae TaxID=2419771 RepID=A0A387BKH3_9MICO|nr:allantoinase AllB [Gryllotalpicola protaetiae]AYG02812.1 allantoinase AllB [Gryllotalpicola protaetiae]
MAEFDTVIRGRIVTPDGEREASVAISNGLIAGIFEADAALDARADLVLADDEVLLPGLVDTHVHADEPGRTEWEGFASATAAAAAGGVTTVIDMPLNSIPPTTTVAALRAKQAAARDQVRVDVGFWGGAVPDNLGTGELRALHDAGAFGFKCFLAETGVDEFRHLDQEQLEQAARELAAFDGLLLVHAEDAGHLHDHAGGGDYADYLSSRPDVAETAAVARVIDVARRTGLRAHIVHVSSAEVLPLLRAAKSDGVRITAETCPHYLTLAADEIDDGDTSFKCAPPIRERANQDALWAALADGTLDLVVSDHSPSTIELKTRGHDFGQAWGGIAGLQLGLPAVWTAARDRGVPLADVVRWMSANTAAFAGLADRGGIAPGIRADLVVFAPEAEFTVDAAALKHKNPITAYQGRALRGEVRTTWLRGEPIGDDHPAGELIARKDD